MSIFSLQKKVRSMVSLQVSELLLLRKRMDLLSLAPESNTNGLKLRIRFLTALSASGRGCHLKWLVLLQWMASNRGWMIFFQKEVCTEGGQGVD